MSWLTGNLVIDWMAIVGSAFLVLVFGGLPAWALWDKLRLTHHGDHWRPIGEPVPATSEPAPAVESRSPFRRKRVAK